jgi:hypothetical protein
MPPLQLRPLPEKFKDEGQIVPPRGAEQFSSVRLPQKKSHKNITPPPEQDLALGKNSFAKAALAQV